jgi:predicted phosphodiesterase
VQLFKQNFKPDFDLYLLSDTHIGSVNTHYDGIKKAVDEIANNKKAHAIILGDLFEGICVDDHRFDPGTADLGLITPDLQAKKWMELFDPIKKKIIYINDGNHDYKLSKTFNIVKNLICEQMGIPYGTYSSKLTVCDTTGKARFKVFTTHGYRSVSSSADDPIRRKANMRLSLKLLLSRKAGDCLVMACGHTHKLLVSRPVHDLYLTDNGKTVKQHYMGSGMGVGGDFIHPDHRYYCNTGSFLRLYTLGSSGYAERFGYDPVELGYIKICVRNYQVVSADEITL